ncbi:orotidine-5'-phosphate decarboxylase [Spiroplasma tabanidicola]|uniref:Orotidine 5'-phosphate decarboxylase n=1 Tax=Spiroplasma tabanidicola TaxID=324079 RepID=A0A6I6C5C3_9MOLU|nr:orotidine-5'-phosphate decarboxylase [Spiroplasma tabanidicola]QGS52047.1 orotidine-5'-phosphate decarboxylase [Spiroplasma tabanidicola]
MNTTPIIALDFSDYKEVKEFLKKMKKERLFLKIGMELFYKYGPRIIKKMIKKNHDIFIDLKLHDIPNTVYKAIKNVLLLKPKIVTVHAFGGAKMLEVTYQAKKELNSDTKILAITCLTSLDDNALKNELNISTNTQETALNLAKLANVNCIDGVVCSVYEVENIKKYICKDFICLTPGIRNEFNNQDQKRVATVLQAKASGSNYIVVGREITKSKDPYQTYLNIKKEWQNG